MTIDERIGKWAVGLLSTAVIALAGFLWNVNAELAVIKSDMLHDKSSKETADEVLKDWSSFKSTQEAHARQLQSIWSKYNEGLKEARDMEKRVSKIEVKLDICCD